MITVNVEKAKAIAHNYRRQLREIEFAPLDALIIKQIPNQNIEEIEQQRQLIRDKYAEFQTQIDGVNAVDGLYTVVRAMENNTQG